MRRNRPTSEPWRNPNAELIHPVQRSLLILFRYLLGTSLVAILAFQFVWCDFEIECTNKVGAIYGQSCQDGLFLQILPPQENVIGRSVTLQTGSCDDGSMPNTGRLRDIFDQYRKIIDLPGMTLSSNVPNVIDYTRYVVFVNHSFNVVAAFFCYLVFRLYVRRKSMRPAAAP